MLATRVQIPERAIPQEFVGDGSPAHGRPGRPRSRGIRSIYDATLSAGFKPHQAATWASIALAESGGNTLALNNHDGFTVCKK